MRSVRTFLPTAGTPAALSNVFTGSPGRWLPDAEPHETGCWTMCLHGGALARSVRARVGSPWSSGRTLWRSLTWDPAEGASDSLARLLPACDGELGLHRLDDLVTVIFDGRYRPPGGQLGAAMDTLGLSRVAQGTVDRLVADVAARLAAAAASPHAVGDRRDDRRDDGRDDGPSHR